MNKTILMLCFFLFAWKLQAQTFSPNRIQYQKKSYKVYQSPAHDIYFPSTSDTLVSYLLRDVQRVMREMEDSLFFQFSRKLNFFLYPSISDLQQSNIGISAEEKLPLPGLHFIGRNILLPYSGSKEEFIERLKYKLAEQYIQSRVYGDEWSAFIRRVQDKNAPGWFLDHLPEYISRGWRPDMDMQFQDVLMRPVPKTFHDLLEQNEQLTSCAFMHYLKIHYGRLLFSNYMNHILQGKSPGSSAKRVFKKPLWEIQQEALLFYVNRYIQDQKNQSNSRTEQMIQKPDTKNRICAARMSPSGRYCTILTESAWYYKVSLLSMYSPKKQEVWCLRKEEVFSIKDVPGMYWTEDINTEKCLIVYKKKGVLYQTKLSPNTLQTGREKMEEIDGIEEMVFSKENKGYLSAYKDGIPDIYEYAGRKISRVTNSKNEETHLFIHPDKKNELVFTSNYLSDTLNKGIAQNKDSLWKRRYTLSGSDIETLKKGIAPYVIMNMSETDETGKRIKTFQNRNYEQSDISGYDEIIESESRNILFRSSKKIHDFLILKDSILLILQSGDSLFRVAQHKHQNLLQAKKTILSREMTDADRRKKESVENKKPEQKRAFGLFGPSEEERKRYQDSLENERYYHPERVSAYRLQFISNDIGAGINNDLLITRYQPYSSQQGQYHQAPLGALAQYAFSDIFEDYQITLGYRLPVNNAGSDYYLSFIHRKNRLDWQLNYLRHVEKFFMPDNPLWQNQTGPYMPRYIRQKTNYAEGMIKYPLHINESLSLAAAWRYDRQIFIATDSLSLPFPDTVQYNVLLKGQYSADYSKEILMDIRKGFRYMIHGEFHLPLKNRNHSFFVLGWDARAYFPLYKNICWANRWQVSFCAGQGLGILYTMGGLQNQISPLADSSTAFSPGDSYTYITYAEGLRGYAQNARYGNTFMLLNTEIRIPVFNTFLNYESAWNLLNHLKLVPFLDVGNAWKLREEGVSTASPWLYSYGLGLHTQLLNYPIRLDWAFPGIKSGLKTQRLTITMNRNF